MHKIAVVVNNANATKSIYETIDAIKEAGFENVFIQWYNEDFEISQQDQLNYIRKQNLNVIFAHLGYQGINNLWEANELGESLVERYISDIRVCKENGIPMVVMHLTSKSTAPQYSEVGLKRIRKIVDYARDVGIQVAFENTKIKGYLDYVLSNIIDEHVGLCLDSGHLHAHFDDELDFELFKNRIFAVHLHDNDGTADQHLMPFEGTIDWNQLISSLKQSNYTGPITLETCYRYEYTKLSLVDFYRYCYEVATKIAKEFD